MAKAQEEENYWPGFVDALSTIVMVVTFLLIILALAIFVMSLRVASTSTQKSSETSTNMVEDQTIAVDSKPIEFKTQGSAAPDLQSDKVLRLTFTGSTIEVDDTSKGTVNEFFDKSGAPDEGGAFDIYAFFDASDAGYTQNKRLSYYRAMAVRNSLLARGFSGEQINVFVREAPTDDRVNAVEIYAK